MTQPSHPVFFAIFPSIMLPMFLAVVDQTIVATALPAIAASLGEVQRASWVVVGYLIANTVAAPVYGQLGDIFGRRRLMFVALAIFLAASLACAAARSIEMLTVARVVQGLGGGGLMTLSQALVGETVPPRERARYQGYLAAVAVTANSFGPVAGGFLTEHLGWRSVFLINLPIGILAVLLTLRLEALPGTRKPFRFDMPGLVLFVLFVAPVLLALERAQRLELGALGWIIGLLGLGITSLALLLVREQRASSPLLPPVLLRQPAIWRSDALAACHGAALVSLITFMPIYLQAVRGLSASQTGLLLLPLTIGIGLGSMLTGRAVSHTGRTTIFPSIGLAVAALTLVLLASWVERLTNGQIAAALGCLAFFMGSVMGVVQVTVQSASGSQMLGAGAATVQFSRSVGAGFGTALVAAVLFGVLAATDSETARLFGLMVGQGPAVIASLPAPRQIAVQAEIAHAFRIAFLTIAGFAVTGLCLALWIPLRRI